MSEEQINIHPTSCRKFWSTMFIVVLACGGALGFYAEGTLHPSFIAADIYEPTKTRIDALENKVIDLEHRVVKIEKR